MELIICKICNSEKYKTEFLFYPSRNYYDKKCNFCRKNIKKQEYQRNKEKYIERASLYQKTYRIENKDKVAENRRKYRKEQRLINPQYIIKERLRSRLRKLLKSKSIKKEERALELLGCTIPVFVEYIEKKFYNDMTWKNKNFEIDHIIPCCWFDLRNEKHRKICFHYKNLQPLTKKDNLKKLDKVWLVYDLNKNPYI